MHPCDIHVSICDTCNLVKAFNSCLLHVLSIRVFFVHPHVYTHSLCVHPTPSVYTSVPLSTLQSLCLHPTPSVYTPLPLSTPHSLCLHPTPSVYTPLPLSTPHSLCPHPTSLPCSPASTCCSALYLILYTYMQHPDCPVVSSVVGI